MSDTVGGGSVASSCVMTDLTVGIGSIPDLVRMMTTGLNRSCVPMYNIGDAASDVRPPVNASAATPTIVPHGPSPLNTTRNRLPNGDFPGQYFFANPSFTT